MSDLQMLKDNPTELFAIFLQKLSDGETLSEEQVVMFEYLKKLLIKAQ